MTKPSILRQDWSQAGLERLSCDVAIIGAGPAGLAAARKLKQLGIAHVMVLERENEPGGIPRHCNHYPYGWHEYHRLLKGPAFAQRNVAAARQAGVDIRCQHSVIQLGQGGLMLLATPAGSTTLKAKRVLIASGIRETPRSARLVSGSRPLGVINTGTLQSEVFLKQLKPFKRPLIVGSELVTLSAIHTCLKAGIRPVAVVASESQPVAPWPLYHYPRLNGIPFHLNSVLTEIHGIERVEAASATLANGSLRKLACDGVLFTGQFVPEASLVRQSHIELDPHTNGPTVDQYGRCSDPAYFAAGNVLRAVETAGWSWREGLQTAGFMAADLAGTLPGGEHAIPIQLNSPLKYCVPQRLVPAQFHEGHLQLRVSLRCKGDVQLTSGSQLLWHKQNVLKPEKRFLIPLSGLTVRHDQPLSIAIQSAARPFSGKSRSAQGDQ